MIYINRKQQTHTHASDSFDYKELWKKKIRCTLRIKRPRAKFYTLKVEN